MSKTLKGHSITYSVDYYKIKIFFNEILHICFPRNKPIVFQSWQEGTEKDSIVYKIELKNGEVSAELDYDNFENWKEIVNIFNKVL
jgi:hypothetical protein